MNENNEIYEVASKVASKIAVKPPSHAETYHIPLKSAYYCTNCDAIGNDAYACPSCTGKELMPLTTWIKSVF